MEPSAVYDMVRIRGTLSFESFGFFGFLRFQYYCCSSLSENTVGFMIHEYTCTTHVLQHDRESHNSLLKIH